MEKRRIKDAAKIAALFKKHNVIRPKLKGEEILQEVADMFEMTVKEMTSRSRAKRYSFPRQIAAYRMRTETTFSFPYIGHLLGGRDHSTAIHAYRKIKRMIENKELEL